MSAKRSTTVPEGLLGSRAFAIAEEAVARIVATAMDLWSFISKKFDIMVVSERRIAGPAH